METAITLITRNINIRTEMIKKSRYEIIAVIADSFDIPKEALKTILQYSVDILYDSITEHYLNDKLISPAIDMAYKTSIKKNKTDSEKSGIQEKANLSSTCGIS